MLYTSDLLTIQDAINAIRQAFDSAARRSSSSGQLIEREYLKFEAVRFRFSNRFMEARRNDRAPLADSIVKELHSDLIDLLRDGNFSLLAETIPVFRKVRPRNSPYSDDLIALVDAPRNVVLREFMERLVSALRGGVVYDEVIEDRVLQNTSRIQDVSRLRSIVPGQKVAPLQFDIENGQLAVRPQHHAVSVGRDAIAATAREELLRRGDALVEELRSSNCDRRLLQNVEELQDSLRDSDNIIRIGMCCIACDNLAKAFSKELPDATAALLLSHTSTVGMYLLQFSDWQKFTEAADGADLSRVDVAALSQTVQQVVDALERDPKLAQPDVPTTLVEIKALLDNPRDSAKRAALAATRTLENMVISIFGFGAEYIEQSVKKTVDTLSTVTSKIVVAALLSTALLAATNLSALGPSVDGLGWMQDAVSIVTRQLDLIRAGE